MVYLPYSYAKQLMEERVAEGEQRRLVAQAKAARRARNAQSLATRRSVLGVLHLTPARR